jgi:hypothetical protein
MKQVKKLGNKKRVVYEGREVPVLVHSPQVWEHPWAHDLGCPFLRRRHSQGTSSTT